MTKNILPIPNIKAGSSKKDRSPQVGFEPTTNRLTADRSTTELLRNNIKSSISYTFKDFCSLNRSIMQESLKKKNSKFFFELWELCVHPTLYSTKKVTIAIPFASRRTSPRQREAVNHHHDLLHCLL